MRSATVMKGHAFRWMGTTVRLLAPKDSDFEVVAAGVEMVFRAIDERFSPFRPDSELSAVNAAAGEWTRVSDQFADLLSLALEGAWATGGLFDPTVLPERLVAALDWDHREVRTGGSGEPPPFPGSRWADVEMRGPHIRLPADARIDLGGVAKGWAVDRACRSAEDLPWALIDAGGDFRLTGRAPECGLQVAVEDPRGREQLALRLSLCEGALATSSITAPTWGPCRHQVIDPRTSRPYAGPVLQATAWAPTCAEAEILANWALLGGPQVLDLVRGVMVLRDGRVVTNLHPQEPGGLAMVP